jgi:hypothetical protein
VPGSIVIIKMKSVSAYLTFLRDHLEFLFVLKIIQKEEGGSLNVSRKANKNMDITLISGIFMHLHQMYSCIYDFSHCGKM